MFFEIRFYERQDPDFGIGWRPARTLGGRFSSLDEAKFFLRRHGFWERPGLESRDVWDRRPRPGGDYAVICEIPSEDVADPSAGLATEGS